MTQIHKEYCPYCRSISPDDFRGNCGACGGRREKTKDGPKIFTGGGVPPNDSYLGASGSPVGLTITVTEKAAHRAMHLMILRRMRCEAGLPTDHPENLEGNYA